MRAAVRGLCALICAVAVHLGVAGVAIACGLFSSEGMQLPTLDLTSVELSFSETPDDTASPVASMPSAEAPQPEREVHPPSPRKPPPMELPPDPSAVPQPDPPSKDIREIDAPLPPDPPVEKPKKPEPPVETPPAPSVAAPAASAPAQARVDAVKPPSPQKQIKPKYPRGARERREEGDVTLELRISAEGLVESAKVVSSCGFAELEAAAIEAAKKARFNPARQDGRPIPYSARITLTFRLK